MKLWDWSKSWGRDWGQNWSRSQTRLRGRSPFKNDTKVVKEVLNLLEIHQGHLEIEIEMVEIDITIVTVEIETEAKTNIEEMIVKKDTGLTDLTDEMIFETEAIVEIGIAEMTVEKDMIKETKGINVLPVTWIIMMFQIVLNSRKWLTK